MNSPSERSPALSRIRRALEAGDSASAGELFALELGLSIADDSAPAGTAGAEGESLLQALESLSPTSIDWWLEVAAGWLAVDRTDLARSCVERARGIVDQGGTVSWQSLNRLAVLERAVTGRRLRKAPASVTAIVPLGPESHLDKRRRLRLLFGYGDDGERSRLFHDRVRDADIVPLVVVSTRPGSGDIDRTDWIYAWCRHGEHRIALEEFLGLVHRHALDDWLPDAGELLVECGKALRYLGDQVTAFACFQLVAWLDPTPDLTRTVRELSWAEAHLQSGEHSFRISPLGPRLGQWMLDRDLGGRYLAHLHQQEGAGLLYPAPVLSRQIRSMAQRSGWFVPALQLPAENHARERSAGPGRPPPSTARAMLSNRRRAGDAAAAGPAERDPVSDLAPPRRGVHSPPSGGTTRVHVGYAIERSGPVPAFADIGPGSNALLLGAADDDFLFQGFASQLLRAGRRLVWLRLGSEPLPTPVVDQGIVLRPTDSTISVNLQWLRDLSTVEEIQASAGNVLTDLIPRCLDPASEACLARLLLQSAGDGIWEALARKDPKRIALEAIHLVSAEAPLPFSSAIGLRRAAVLVGHLIQAMSALQRALGMTWHRPPEEAPKVQALLMHLHEKEPALGALAGVLALGSLLQTVEINRRASVTDAVEFDQFDLNVRKRSSNKTAEGDEKDVSKVLTSARALHGESRRGAAAMDTNPWIETGFLTRGEAQELTVLVSGPWGPEVHSFARWFQAGGLGERHCLVLGLRSATAEQLRGPFLGLFKTFMVGDLDAFHRRLFEIGTGVRLTEREPQQSAYESVMVRLADRKVNASPVVILPQSP